MTAVTLTGASGAPFNGWLGFYRWTPATLTYSFPDNFPDDIKYFSYLNGTTLTPLNTAQKDTVRAAFAQIQSFTTLTFVETADYSGQTPLRFAQEAGLEGGYAYLPDFGDSAGDGFFGSFTVAPRSGNEAYLYFIHEIGHAMGLDHGHEAPAFAASPLNSQEYTVMTYADYAGDPDLGSYDGGPVDWAQSYMQLDIAALQFLYGANYAASGQVWSGDSVYRFDPATGQMSINGAGQGAPAGNRIFRTIWDGGGDDTYDLSNYTSDLDITLKPGGFSTFAKAQLADLNRFDPSESYLAAGNLANARLAGGDVRGLIENAAGGSGNDSIRGNKATNALSGGAGVDSLFGHNGSDLLRGDSGDDRLIGGSGPDRLDGGDGNDVLKGSRGGDALEGGGGGDDLRGGGGRDILAGGAGIDLLTGGRGSDDFVFRAIEDAPAGAAVEHIADFTSRRDDLDFSALAGVPFTLALNGTLPGGAPAIATQAVAGGLLVSVDVTGSGAADMMLMLDGAGGLLARDFIL